MIGLSTTVQARGKEEEQMKYQEMQGAKYNGPQREAYEPPNATFIPLKVEERVLACGKQNPALNGPGSSCYIAHDKS